MANNKCMTSFFWKVSSNDDDRLEMCEIFSHARKLIQRKSRKTRLEDLLSSFVVNFEWEVVLLDFVVTGEYKDLFRVVNSI